MKVLFIQKMAGVAGSEVYYLNLLPELVKQGLEVHFACVEHPDDTHKNDDFRIALREGGVACHNFRARHSVPIGALWALRRLIRSGHFDLVQTNLIHADLWGAIIKISMLGKLTLISAKHGYSESYQAAHGFDPTHLKQDLFSLVTRFAGLFANRIFCISSGLNDFLVQGGLVNRSKTSVINYGFDFDTAPRWLARGESRYGTQQIVVVARLVAVKQHQLLLDCLPDVVAAFPELKVIMIGDGPLKEELDAYAHRIGVANHVKWLGFQRNVQDYIRDSDFLVLPSSAEGFGVVVLEAWVNRKPVVAFDVPALNELIVHNENGLLLAPFDKSVLAQSLTVLLNDPSRVAKMGNEGFARYRAQYSLHSLVSRTLALYNDVLGN